MIGKQLQGLDPIYWTLWWICAIWWAIEMMLKLIKLIIKAHENE
jgi:hypothetical protein